MHYKEHGPRQLEVEITAKSSKMIMIFIMLFCMWCLRHQSPCIQSSRKIGFEVFVDDKTYIVIICLFMIFNVI